MQSASTINRYTPVPPITPSVAGQTSDGEEDTSTTSDDDQASSADDDDQLDEEFHLDEDDDFDQVKSVLKNLKTFDIQVRNSLR